MGPLPHNQPPPLENYNLLTTDRALRDGLGRACGAAAIDDVEQVGEAAGAPEAIALGFDANENPPRLRTHDRFGNRIDEVRFHPAWHALMERGASFGLGAAAWEDRRPAAHARRAAKFYLWGQVESGHGCPLSMTYAAFPVVRADAELAAAWTALLAAPRYDPRPLPVARKFAALAGMGMTERQGGSDVRANETRATAVPGAKSRYLLHGHKWFCSAPASDAFLMLAQAAGGLSCFFVPRMRDDGTRNAIALLRLKEKLGNRSNASAEIELDGAQARIVGDEGEGLARIVEMVNSTRLDCAIGSAALMRAALAQAIHHATYRYAFGRALIDQPLMQSVLADLSVESEAATALFLRVARTLDDAPADPNAASLRRIGTALAKYFVCKRAPTVVGEALECLGGNGYVEESILPRLYREAPLNSIWEGSGNINALDVVRILAKDPAAYAAWRAEIEPAAGEPAVARALRAIDAQVRGEIAPEQARTMAERLALTWQASLLVRHAPDFVGGAFLATRLGGDGGRLLGTLPATAACRRIVDRAAPYGAS